MVVLTNNLFDYIERFIHEQPNMSHIKIDKRPLKMILTNTALERDYTCAEICYHCDDDGNEISAIFYEYDMNNHCEKSKAIIIFDEKTNGNVFICNTIYSFLPQYL